MKKVFLLLITALLVVGCGSNPNHDEEDKLTLTSKFKSTWNIHEKLVRNADGTITYTALPWGGLIGSMREHNLPVDWSAYESVTIDFAEPTPVETQVLISDKLKTWGKAGITSLTCYFDGQDMTSVDELMLQASDTCTLVIKQVKLAPVNGTWHTTPIRSIECAFGNWANGFVIKPEAFEEARKGDKLEFIFTTDKSDPNVNYWLFKTIYNGTDTPLEGNANELNKWGCAAVGREGTVYRVVLTANDVAQLREHGLFVNGYYITVTQCNLLRKEFNNTSRQKDS